MKNKGGRPRKKISKRQFEELCKLQCTQKEICDVLDVSDKPLERWCKETYGMSFSDIYAQKREGGKMSLRRTQFKLAQTSASMAIFLGKQYLGQTDKVESNVKAQISIEDYLKNNDIEL